DERQRVPGEGLPAHHHEPADQGGEDGDHGTGPVRVDHVRVRPHVLDVQEQVPREVHHATWRSVWWAGASGWPTTTSRPSEAVSTSTGVPYSSVSVREVMTSAGGPQAAPPWPR